MTEPATCAVKLVWHHLPSHGPERKNVNGLTTSGRNVDRVMEPDVFTRFERVRYEAYFSFSDDYLAPTMSIDKDLLDTHFKYGTGCRVSATQVIQTFIDLLSTTPPIKFLEVSLSVETYPDYYFDDDSDDDCFLGNKKKNVENDEVVSTRYYELFLESGVLKPLKQLTNVRCFALDSALISSPRQRKFLEPQEKHLDVINNLKAVIEHNWVGRQTCTAAVGVKLEDQSASQPKY